MYKRVPKFQTSSWHNISYGNGEFVACNNIGTSIRSKDGVHWTLCGIPYVSPSLPNVSKYVQAYL